MKEIIIVYSIILSGLSIYLSHSLIDSIIDFTLGWSHSTFDCCSTRSSGFCQVAARQRIWYRRKGQCKYKKISVYACFYKVINKSDEHCKEDIDEMRWNEIRWDEIRSDKIRWLLIDDEDDVWIVYVISTFNISYEIKWRFSLVSF